MQTKSEAWSAKWPFERLRRLLGLRSDRDGRPRKASPATVRSQTKQYPLDRSTCRGLVRDPHKIYLA